MGILVYILLNDTIEGLSTIAAILSVIARLLLVTVYWFLKNNDDCTYQQKESTLL